MEIILHSFEDKYVCELTGFVAYSNANAPLKLPIVCVYVGHLSFLAQIYIYIFLFSYADSEW